MMPFQFVAVGTSFGGFHALKTVLGGLRNDFPLPIGVLGLRRIKDNGGYVMVQDPSAAVGRILPKAAIASVAVDEILPLEEIAPSLRALCVGQRTVV